MCKRITLLAMMLVFACGLVWAGDAAKAPAANSQMAQMKEAMLKCYVCKNVASKFDEIGPMGMEAVQLNDGVEFRHWAVSNDPKKVAAFHAACNACSAAGQETVNWTDERAKTDLCEFCQGLRTAAKSGAHISAGSTEKADVSIWTSSDPAVQSQLSGLQKKCEMMASMMKAPAAGKASAEK